MDAAEFTAENFISKDMVKNCLTQFSLFTNSEYERKNLITYFVNKIIAFDHKIIIVYNHYGNNCVEFDISELDKIEDENEEVRIYENSPRQLLLRTNTMQMYYIFINGIPCLIVFKR